MPDYGAERRRLRVMKYRGRRYRGGHHDFTIVDGGLRVFPRLFRPSTGGISSVICCRADHRSSIRSWAAAWSGGTSCLILGPAGTGKSLLTLFFVAS